MLHIVNQLKFTRSEFRKGFSGVSEDEGSRRFHADQLHRLDGLATWAWARAALLADPACKAAHPSLN
jgi:hypothetical protein